MKTNTHKNWYEDILAERMQIEMINAFQLAEAKAKREKEKFGKFGSMRDAFEKAGWKGEGD